MNSTVIPNTPWVGSAGYFPERDGDGIIHLGLDGWPAELALGRFARFPSAFNDA